jgi:hypothetical protein
VNVGGFTIKRDLRGAGGGGGGGGGGRGGEGESEFTVKTERGESIWLRQPANQTHDAQLARRKRSDVRTMEMSLQMTRLSVSGVVLICVLVTLTQFDVRRLVVDSVPQAAGSRGPGVRAPWKRARVSVRSCLSLPRILSV